ncbi:ABC transporter substrate-binding protein [Pseudomonas sp. SLFW]|uniref:ABC transporter substrate-binding protein n=1 Tax=Pseudomonas sp. SLFW TaxID=2683259 RepID=UPI001412056A|nr:ABC transporter substrate-binding protein [Pseudomonas sp. SLFW]NBB09208.1 twin-arginine translocation signal domain-containing protein [Pseudomonas sp. SLFW]
MSLSRRTFIKHSTILAAAAGLSSHASGLFAATDGTQTLVVSQFPEPTVLTNALTTDGTIYTVTSKLFDGLLSYDSQRQPVPRLATDWHVSADGLVYTFNLRAGVTWHDGQPFSADDVAFSLQNIWRKFNSRGITTFAPVSKVETPTPLQVVITLSAPAPYLLSALSSTDAQVLPKHLYANGNPLTNPYNIKPIGTGPFKFERWDRGVSINLVKNEHYWDTGKPHLDSLIFRIIPDLTAASAALETQAVQLASVALSNVKRLHNVPQLQVSEISAPYSPGLVGFEFNLEKPVFQDVRVRQAFAHAVDRDFIVKNIYFGFAKSAYSAIPSSMSDFYDDTVPRYPFDLAKAEALLEEAGLKKGADGVRLTVYNDPNPANETLQIAHYLRSNLAKIGVKLVIRSQDFPEYVNRVYTRRDFDTTLISATAGPDPVMGTQRFYQSSNFKPGIAFSNGARYANPRVDELLAQGQGEVDPVKRKALYAEFQQIVLTDLPKIPLVSPTVVVVTQKQLKDFFNSSEALYGNFADARYQA